jgi:hypothetical protein
VIAVGVVIAAHSLAVAQPGQSTDQHQIAQSAEHNQSSLFFAIGAWARDNRDAIDPLVAIGALVIAGLVAYATARLYGATRRLALTTGDLANAARQQVVEMELARALMAQRLDLQEKQFLLAGKQSDLAAKQHGLQREQYLAEHRPRIKIRSVGVRQATACAMFDSDQVVKGSLVVVNIGASEATIREANYRFFSGERGLPMVPPLEPKDVKPLFEGLLPHKMAGHESCLIPIEGNGTLGDLAFGLGFGGMTGLYVMGAIRFSDWNLQDRWMGFCQQYMPSGDGGEGRFAPVENSDYEYED